MEFLEGQTLAQRLEKGPLPIAELVETAIQIAEALDHAHRAAICHRDLKPANVMLTKNGVKLLDFGLARALGTPSVPAGGETATMALTRDGVILGTLPYMSPEQLEGKPGDARSDIFAFGAVLYEMATGRRAFPGIIGREPDRQHHVSRSAAYEHHAGARHAVRDPARARKDCPAMSRERSREPLAERSRRCGCSRTGDGPARRHRRRSNPNGPGARGWRGLFAAAVIAAISVALIYFLIPPAPEPGAVTFTIPPPQDALFYGRSTPAVSPDGRRIAFVAASGSVSRIWIRSLDAMQSRPLAGTEGTAHELFWSPDGKNVAFDAGGKLKRVSADGGPAQIICDAPNLRGGSWNQDGVIIFVPNVVTGVYRVPASGGTPAPVTALDESRGENSHRWPQFLAGRQTLPVLGADRQSRGLGNLPRLARSRQALRAQTDSQNPFECNVHTVRGAQ